MMVENITVPGGVTTPELEERRVKALEDQAKAALRQAIATELLVTIQQQAGAPFLGDPRAQRFERVLLACIAGRVATDVEGFLTFARELCDGIDREFPAPE